MGIRTSHQLFVAIENILLHIACPRTEFIQSFTFRYPMDIQSIEHFSGQNKNGIFPSPVDFDLLIACYQYNDFCFDRHFVIISYTISAGIHGKRCTLWLLCGVRWLKVTFCHSKYYLRKLIFHILYSRPPQWIRNTSHTNNVLLTVLLRALPRENDVKCLYNVLHGAVKI